jgi:hypothetical protein
MSMPDLIMHMYGIMTLQAREKAAQKIVGQMQVEAKQRGVTTQAEHDKESSKMSVFQRKIVVASTSRVHSLLTY